MKRRDFVAKGTAGVLGAGFAGSVARKVEAQQLPQSTPDETGKVEVWRELSHFAPRPKGTMPMKEIGKTGIKVSKLTFGSHINREMVGYDYQREYVIREAFDLGVNSFDIYDTEGGDYQYEPMGKILEPINKDVVISLSIRPAEGRNVEQEFERALKLFNRDHIDLVRSNLSTDLVGWQYHDYLAKCKEKGMIRAIGVAIHSMQELMDGIDKYPIDYVLFPYNFYQNRAMTDEELKTLPSFLRDRGIGVVTMKPFAGDNLVAPFIQVGRQFTGEAEVRYPQAALRYILNSGVDADSVFCAMHSINHIYDDIKPFYEPEMSTEERELLGNIKNTVISRTRAWLPDHYKWLENWVSKPEDNEISSSV